MTAVLVLPNFNPVVRTHTFSSSADLTNRSLLGVRSSSLISLTDTYTSIQMHPLGVLRSLHVGNSHDTLPRRRDRDSVCFLLGYTPQLRYYLTSSAVFTHCTDAIGLSAFSSRRTLSQSWESLCGSTRPLRCIVRLCLSSRDDVSPLR